MSHNWVLSQRSRGKLEGVHLQLAKTVKLALDLSPIDFGVTEGKRELSRQKELVARGLSQTMNSKHLDGRAVDLVAYLNGKVCWEMSAYDELADAMKQAAKQTNLAIRWGGAWQINDIRSYEGTMEDAMNEYIDLRRSQGRRPFLDGPHFEIH
jgi:peptidoglycan L-alanyl-D-glutamate endopeptidase CwlK